MGIIRELDSNLINKIAAGEVIESPCSVVKELLENSVDANSYSIEIETKEGGLDLIVVADNGSGISEDDLELSIKKHATSKISDLNDLNSIYTYGFRGEALASIASISKLKIESGTEKDYHSWKIETMDGKIINKEEIHKIQGTKIYVQNLFYNTPVRRKFLKSIRSEDKRIKDKVILQALVKNEIQFRLVQNSKETINVKPQSKKDRILALFGKNIENYLLPVELEKDGLKGYGFISDPNFYKSNRSGQFIFINDRPIELKYFSSILKKCYGELLPHNAHPFAFLFFEINPEHIDVNVHPAKKEIRFLSESYFNAFLIQLIDQQLRSTTPLGFLELKNRLTKPFDSNFSKSKFDLESQQTTFQTLTNSSFQSNPTFVNPYSVLKASSGIKLEDLTQKVETNLEFIPKKHYGIIFETFILAEAEDGLYIIDQHTAHERIRYEEMLNKLERKQFEIQPLLTPMRFDFTKEDEEIIQFNEQYLTDLGLKFEALGEGTFVLREVPAYLKSGQEKEIIFDFLRSINSNFSEGKNILDTLAKCVACRSAVKKGDQLSDHLIAEMLNRLSHCQNPSRCPHGRPTLVKLTKFDLEKMFHRR